MPAPTLPQRPSGVSTVLAGRGAPALGREDIAALEAGLDQRVRAVETFLSDAYGPCRAVAEGVVDEGLIVTATGFSRQAGQVPTPARWAPLSTFGLARGPSGRWLVTGSRVGALDPGAGAPVDRPPGPPVDLPADLSMDLTADPVADPVAGALASCSPPDVPTPTVAVLLPPGAAPPWRAFAQRHALVAARPDDLRVSRGQLLLATTAGLVPVHVLVRPVADDGLDPVVGADPSAASTGVPGLLSAVRSGSVALAGALGAGLADEARVRARFGDLVRFHLGEEPLLGDAPATPAGAATLRALVAATGAVDLRDARPTSPADLVGQRC